MKPLSEVSSMEQQPAKPKQHRSWKDLSRGEKTLIILIPIIMIFLLSIAFHSSNSSTNTTNPPTQPAKPSAQPQKLTVEQKQQVSTDLNNELATYVDPWHQGEQVLGTTQYADSNAGLAAMDDPNSAAAKFSAWRQSSNIERDVTTYQNAFKSADNFYTAANEPQAISSYQDDIGTLQADISTWVTDTVGWQIQTTSNATMTKDVQ